MKIVHTRDTMSQLYLDAVKIRQTVFVKEQGVPEELEIDQDEAKAIHFVLYDPQATATLRLLPLDDRNLKLQRMAVLKEFRGKDYGRHLVLAAEAFAQENLYQTITLGAQLTAIDFYQHLGYQPVGEIFWDAGIQHQKMSKTL